VGEFVEKVVAWFARKLAAGEKPVVININIVNVINVDRSDAAEAAEVPTAVVGQARRERLK
jgi:hypothetical protein